MAQVARRVAWLLAFANAVIAMALLFGDAGSSTALAFLALVLPLQVWGGGFLAAAALLVAGEYLAGHTVAVVTNAMLAAGAVVGVVTATTTSPAGSIMLAGVLITVAGLHVHWMVFRHREAQVRRK
jgi:hypothetical protein